MCGIFGLVVKKDQNYNQILDVLNNLFLLSEERGREASGIAFRISDCLHVLKMPITASSFISSKAYSNLQKEIENSKKNSWSVIGHCRLATNGLQESNLNNHPVVAAGAVGVHNGIIVNVDSLYNEFDFLNRASEVDTELFLELLQKFRTDGNGLQNAVCQVYDHIYGETSVAVMFDDISETLLATNTGSLYYVQNDEYTLFASEYFIVKSILEKYYYLGFDLNNIQQLKPGYGAIVGTGFVNEFELNISNFNNELVLPTKLPIIDHSRNILIPSSIRVYDSNQLMRKIVDQPNPNDYVVRCTRCLLPHTFPYIDFDDEGVCNFCRTHTPYVVKGETELRRIIDPYRNNNGKPDCLVGFSGGRDSCYLLHYLKKELGMNPIAFTYDWGMVTDLARRNQARMCGKLGIEHIWISADIHQKRENIRKNIAAWLKKPDLGMVPLLMAGDKQFYYYAHKVMEQTGVELIFSGANFFEKTAFKTGFCGIREGETRDKGLLTGISLLNKLKLIGYYGSQFIQNAAYLNSSIFDTIDAFYSSYVLPDAYTYLYNYIRWDEHKIMNILIKEYDWETAIDTESTWRIGDGTAAFYNYIYYTVAGFSEFDTFRSNQIREGLITRTNALACVQKENLPRYDSLKWYSNMVGFDLEYALDVIHNIPKLWDENEEIN